ncbi:Serine/arginine repetitive matrix protein 1, variant 2 [Bonamia ostreae]|uniref:Serine/arginine repetitive matrix protein 1, variant 2 n=1 Tax=Bonamia ostreae TaxID=126728 RepID=A0ABV2AL88_9EUKA
MTTFYKGTTIEQSYLFKDKQKKLKSKMAFPKCFRRKIDIKKVNIDVIAIWIKRKTNDILDFDDDVLNGMIVNMLKEGTDPKEIQIFVTGFLEKKAYDFMKELWKLLIKCSKSESGISKELLEEEKKFFKLKKIDKEEKKKRERREFRDKMDSKTRRRLDQIEAETEKLTERKKVVYF